MIAQAILYTDGGSRGNPGPSGIGFALVSCDKHKIQTLAEGGCYIGKATNNEAEYKAMLWGLKNAQALAVQHIHIRADSELLVKQVKGEYKVHSKNIKPLHEQLMMLLRSFVSYGITHVYREDNSRADALANKAMDLQSSVGRYRVSCPELSSAAVDSHAKMADDKNVILHTTTGSTKMNNTSSPATNMQENSGKGVYTLAIKNHFDAAHALVGYPGECRQLHGHTWDVEVIVSGRQLDDVGIVYDFKDLKANLLSILNDYDHVFLNDVPPFDAINATAENLARVIYERLETMLPAQISLDEVSVWESPIAKLTYKKE